MTPFTIDAFPTVHSAWGSAKGLGALIAGRFAARRAVIVTFASFVRRGALAPILADLAAHGFSATVFDRIVADPSEGLILEAVKEARAAGADIVLGIGGGSSLDAAKLVAVLLGSDQPIDTMYGIDQVRDRRAVPLVAVPTTAGTGSEVTPISVVTTPSETKMAVIAPALMPDLAVLDAELTVGLPAAHTAASGIDAMVHAIEAFTTRHRKNPVSDMLAVEALRLLAANIVTACREGTNREAREAMLLGSMLAGQAFTNAPVAAVHALAYPLGGQFHISHGLANALMLVPVLRYNASAAAPHYAALATALGFATSGDDIARSNAFVDAIETILTDAGAPRRLREAGVTAEAIPRLAADGAKQTRLIGNNPVDMVEKDILALYEAAY